MADSNDTLGTQASKAIDTVPVSSASPQPTSRMNPEKGTLEPDKNGLYLDSGDPFEAACIEMVKMNRAKRRDYALDGDPFSNFHMSSAMLGLDGFGPVESVQFNLMQKMARLHSLRKNGRMGDTANEAVDDTYLDIAVYSTILLAMVKAFK